LLVKIGEVLVQPQISLKFGDEKLKLRNPILKKSDFFVHHSNFKFPSLTEKLFSLIPQESFQNSAELKRLTFL